MTARTSILLILLSMPALVFNQTAERTMLKSFNLHGKSSITVDLPGQVEVKTWDNPHLKIQISVALPNATTSILDELATVGRYDLQEKTTGTEMTVTSEKLTKVIKIRGQELKEQVSYLVFAPKELPVTVVQQTLAANANK